MMHRRMLLLGFGAYLLLWTDAVELVAVETTTSLGPVRVETKLLPDKLRIGDEVTFEITVRAEPDVEVLMPEFGEALDRYQILDFVPQRRADDNGEMIHQQRYTLQPVRSGEHSIPPILIEFVDRRPNQPRAPDGLDAYEILTDRIDFVVESVVPQEASSELRPMLDELKKPVARTTTQTAVWIGLPLVIVGATLIGFVLWKRRAKRVRKVNAYEIARKRLDAELAKPLPIEDGEIDRYFVAVSGIVRRYLENRFELRAPDLTTEEFLELAGRSQDLSSEHQSLLRDFLRQADLVKFAGVKATSDEIKRAGELASRFLDETRQDAPEIEVQGPGSVDPDATSSVLEEGVDR